MNNILKLILIIVILWFIGYGMIFGYINNVVRINDCESDNCTIVRIVGIIIPPAGMVMGHMEIKE